MNRYVKLIGGIILLSSVFAVGFAMGVAWYYPVTIVKSVVIDPISPPNIQIIPSPQVDPMLPKRIPSNERGI